MRHKHEYDNDIGIDIKIYSILNVKHCAIKEFIDIIDDVNIKIKYIIHSSKQFVIIYFIHNLPYCFNP